MAGVDVDEAIAKVLKLFEIDGLKREQRQMLDALLAKKDCMAVLPTGYGKSLPFQMIVSLRRELGDHNQKVVVCSPLVALMHDQCERLKTIPGIKAEYKGGSTEGDLNIKKGAFDYLYASPEALVGDKHWRHKLAEFPVSTIVIDEFHTISTWGEDEEDNNKAFRKWFSYIGEVRSVSRCIPVGTECYLHQENFKASLQSFADAR